MLIKKQLLYEGKAKKLYESNLDSQLIVEYKDDLTAFNGEKKDVQQGKGALNNQISSLIFNHLKQLEISHHWIEQLSETEQLVKHTEIIPIEVVVRNVAAGSLSNRLGLKEGTPLNETIVEFYYKNDALGDPLINRDHIKLLKLASKDEIELMKQQALEINEILVNLFKKCDLQLIDFKLEFGKDEVGQLILSDEISPDTCRLWDAHTFERLDKDVFRRELGSVTETYRTILQRLNKAVVMNG